MILAKNAYFSLLAASDDVTFANLIKEFSSPAQVYAAILNFYKPRTVGDIAQLHRQLSNARLKKGQGPTNCTWS